MPNFKTKRLRKKRTKRKPLKIALISGLVGAALLSIIQLVFNFGEWQHLGLHAIIGLFLGLLVAPELEPNHFESPVLWQAFCAGTAGFLFGISMGFSANHVVACCVVGVVLGITAKWWLNHLPIP